MKSDESLIYLKTYENNRADLFFNIIKSFKKTVVANL